MTARNKDPKKVAAGYAGAAARKEKKHQEFLDKSRDAKPASLAGETVPASSVVVVPDVGTTVGSMKQLIIVGGGVLLLLLAALRLSERRQVATGTMQLKVERQEDIQPAHSQRCLFTVFK